MCSKQADFKSAYKANITSSRISIPHFFSVIKVNLEFKVQPLMLAQKQSASDCFFMSKKGRLCGEISILQ